MLKVLIRRLTQADELFLWEMLYHAVYVPEGHEPFPKEIVAEPEIARYVLLWGKPNDDGFGAVDEITQQLVGAVWIRLFTSENQGYGYVRSDIPEVSMAVLPGHRNNGIGTDLLRHMIAEARKRYLGLSLSVSSQNPARHLYERMGFEAVARHGTSLTMLKSFDAVNRLENRKEEP